MIAALRLPLLGAVLLTVGALVWLASVALQDAKLRIAVEGAKIQFEPGYIRLRVRVEPEKANRGLMVAAISDGFETSSYEQLEGNRSPRTRWFTFRDVPAGEYAIIARVDRGAEPVWYARTALTVLAR